MLFGNPWGLMALLAIPAILYIHLFRRRYPERPSSALFLWGATAQPDTSGQRQDRLRQRTSLYAELLAALAVSLLLSDPHISDSVPAVHHIWLLDSQARLQASHHGMSVHQRLRTDLSKRLARLPEQDRISLISSARQGQLLAHAVPAREAIAALADWRADRGVHSLTAARQLAQELGDTEARRYLASDRPLPENDGWGLLCHGQAIAQSGLTAAIWHRQGATEYLFLHCFNSGKAHSRHLLLGQQQVAIRLPTGASQHRLPLVDPPSELSLRFSENDSFAVDDAVTLLRPAAQQVRVRNDLDQPVLQRALQAVAAVQLVATEAQLRFSHASRPVLDDCWQVQITTGSPHRQLGPFLTRRHHPLLQDVPTEGLLWLGGSDDHSATVLLAAGDQVLIDQAENGKIRLFADLTQSHFDRHPAWPTLIHNLIHWRADQLPGPRRINAAAGAAVDVCLGAPFANARLRTPQDTLQELQADANGQLVLTGLSAGRWQVVDTHDQPVSDIAVHRLSPMMSDFSQTITIESAATAGTGSEVERRRGRWSWIIPALLGLLAALVAWRVYAREEGLAR